MKTTDLQDIKLTPLQETLLMDIHDHGYRQPTSQIGIKALVEKGLLREFTGHLHRRYVLTPVGRALAKYIDDDRNRYVLESTERISVRSEAATAQGIKDLTKLLGQADSVNPVTE